MWLGTDEEYYELYDVTTKHLKACFGDKIKVGGYASCGFYAIFADPQKYGLDVEKRTTTGIEVSERGKYLLDYLFKFLDYIKEHNSPMDFFAWHSYTSVEDTEIMADFLDRVLTEYGYGDVETHINEWNNAFRKEMRGTSVASARAAAMMCAMQNKKTNILCYYDARIGASVYGGMFNPITYKPFCLYYPFLAFGELYRIGNQMKCECDEKGVYAVAASDGTKKAVMIANISEECKTIETNVNDKMDIYLIDENHFMTKEEMNAKEFVLEKNQVVFIKNY